MWKVHKAWSALHFKSKVSGFKFWKEDSEVVKEAHGRLEMHKTKINSDISEIQKLLQSIGIHENIWTIFINFGIRENDFNIFSLFP